MAETNKPSIEISEGAKIVGNLNYGFSWREKPICDAALEKLADDLVKWSKKTKAVDIEAFFDERDLNIDSFYPLMQRNKCFKEAYELAMQKLGTKRSEGVAKFKLKESWVRIAQYKYHKSFGEGEARQAELHKKDTGTTVESAQVTVNDKE